MRLIDATKAIESIDEIVCSMSVCINSDYYNGMRAMKDMALHAIEKQPTVDAVRVVRCRDCKWLGIGASGEGTRLVMCCKKGHDTTEDDYCSEGEGR